MVLGKHGTEGGAMNSIPLKKRPLDIAIVVYFLFNILFITYFFDLVQIVIPNASHFSYPAWPPPFLVNLENWYGHTFDPLLFARPVWWRATIWIEVIFFGPFYVAAIYAFFRGKSWIRIPSIMYSSVMLTNVTIILSEEIWGPHASPALGMVVGSNASWMIFPILIIIRMWPDRPPFAERRGAAAETASGDAAPPVGLPPEEAR